MDDGFERRLLYSAYRRRVGNLSFWCMFLASKHPLRRTEWVLNNGLTKRKTAVRRREKEMAAKQAKREANAGSSLI